MLISFMRRIDWYVGIPVCYLVGNLRRLQRSLSQSPVPPIRNILVIKFLGLGSIVLTAPAIEALRQQFPSTTIYFLTFESNQEGGKFFYDPENIFTIETTSLLRFIKSSFLVIWQLRQKNIDLVVNFEFFANFPLLLAAALGARRIAGYDFRLESWRHWFLDYRGYYNYYYHIKDIFLSLVYLIGEEDPYYQQFEAYRKRYTLRKIPIESHWRNEARAQLPPQKNKRLIIINPNASEIPAQPVRLWPASHFSLLMQKILTAYPDSHIALIGSPDESRRVQSIIKELPKKFHPSISNLAGATNLRTLLGLCSLAKLFITLDSGPMHIACLTEVPIIALFFADTPTLFGPLSDKAHVISPQSYALPLYSVQTGKQPLVSTNLLARRVSPDIVFQVVQQIL
jgi:ADP-heptose:LPS heptosyltransferase